MDTLASLRFLKNRLYFLLVAVALPQNRGRYRILTHTHSLPKHQQPRVMSERPTHHHPQATPLRQPGMVLDAMGRLVPSA